MKWQLIAGSNIYIYIYTMCKNKYIDLWNVYNNVINHIELWSSLCPLWMLLLKIVPINAVRKIVRKYDILIISFHSTLEDTNGDFLLLPFPLHFHGDNV